MNEHPNDVCFNKARTLTGLFTGASYRCKKKGCSGRRLTVRWVDGKITHPCGADMDFINRVGWVLL